MRVWAEIISNAFINQRQRTGRSERKPVGTCKKPWPSSTYISWQSKPLKKVYPSLLPHSQVWIQRTKGLIWHSLINFDMRIYKRYFSEFFRSTPGVMPYRALNAEEKWLRLE